jgi:hypothetical protein
MKEAKQNRERLIKKRAHEIRAQEQTSVTLMLVCRREKNLTFHLNFLLGYCSNNIFDC